jgi:hypothetical protein
MKCIKVGAYFEMMNADGGYQIVSGDLYKCESCETTTARGFGRPLAHATQLGYEEFRRHAKPIPWWPSLRDKLHYEARLVRVGEERVEP